MRKLLALGLLLALPIVSGCGGQKVPAKLEVRDNTSGRTYLTYEDMVKEEKGVGYKLIDSSSGAKVTLTNYEVKEIQKPMTADPKSVEATEYVAAKAKATSK